MKDLAEKKHWDERYDALLDCDAEWKPSNYEELLLEKMLTEAIKKYSPQNVLEIGCGNSVWLPYIYKKFNIAVYGLDYSETGCALARKNLERNSAEGAIICGDLFKTIPEEIGQFDMVYSLGVVEHFSDLEFVISKIFAFVKPNGILLTEVPNMNYWNKILSWLYQPSVLNKHKLVTDKMLHQTYEKLKFDKIECGYIGLISFISLGVTKLSLKSTPAMPHIYQLLTSLPFAIFTVLLTNYVNKG